MGVYRCDTKTLYNEKRVNTILTNIMLFEKSLENVIPLFAGIKFSNRAARGISFKINTFTQFNKL